MNQVSYMYATATDTLPELPAKKMEIPRKDNANSARSQIEILRSKMEIVRSEHAMLYSKTAIGALIYPPTESFWSNTNRKHGI